ncbi:MAG TPA: hypothetical protein DC049_00470 [Spirochaetia bacterium]|nr:hypothetical protein [Spirochaetia bacterium]
MFAALRVFIFFPYYFKNLKSEHIQKKSIPQSNDLSLRKLRASPAGYSQKPDFVRFVRNKPDKIIADRDNNDA